MEDVLLKVKKEWESQYRSALRNELVNVCNSHVLNPDLIVIGQSLECDIKSIVVDCLKDLSKDIENNILVLK